MDVIEFCCRFHRFLGLQNAMISYVLVTLYPQSLSGSLVVEHNNLSCLKTPIDCLFTGVPETSKISHVTL